MNGERRFSPEQVVILRDIAALLALGFLVGDAAPLARRHASRTGTCAVAAMVADLWIGA